MSSVQQNNQEETFYSIKIEINDSTTSHNNNMSVELESDKDSVSSLVMKATELINEHKREESR